MQSGYLTSTKFGLKKATSQFQCNWFKNIKDETIVFMKKMLRRAFQEDADLQVQAG